MVIELLAFIVCKNIKVSKNLYLPSTYGTDKHRNSYATKKKLVLERTEIGTDFIQLSTEKN